MPPFDIEQPICSLDFTLDGVVLAHQPFSVRLVYPSPGLDRTVAGRYLGAKQFGRRAVVQWGEDYCPAAAIAELEAVLGANSATVPPTAPHSIGWNEPDGSVVTLSVVAERLRRTFEQGAVGFYDPVILTFWERP